MTGGRAPNIVIFDVYEAAFVHRCHELVILGHRRLASKSLAALDETAITGHLCDAMEAALDADDRPAWATQFTTVDDQPESVRGTTGKRRPRTDVCVRCIDPRPARRFRFEAKRLNNNQSLRDYLGDDGMLALITGHYGDLPHAGMIGYVQIDTCAAWSDRIKAAITKDPAAYYAVLPARFDDLALSGAEAPFSSSHEYGESRARRRITHTLLQCQ